MVDAPPSPDDALRPGRGRVGGNLVAVAAFRGLAMLVGIVSTAVLVRLLDPADFGLMDMMSTLLALLATGGDLGLSLATVQRKDVTHAQVSTLFWLNLALGVAMFAVCAASGPLVAWFFEEPDLIPVAAVVGLSFVFTGLGAQPLGVLHRRAAFVKMGVAEVAAPLVGLAGAVVVALNGGAHWAIVGKVLGTAVVRAIGYLFLSGFVPTRPRRGTGVRPMLRFGGYLVGFNLLNFAVRNLDYILLGKLWGKIELAYYYRAYWLFSLPLMLNKILERVALPALSRYQTDHETVRSLYRGVLRFVLLTSCAAAAFVLGHADLLVAGLLGPKFGPSLPMLRWLAVIGLLLPVMHSTGMIYTSIGRTDRMFRWSLLSVIPIAAAIIIGVRDGGLGVARAYSIVSVALVWFGMAYAFPVIGFSYRVFLVDLVVGSVPTAVSVGASMLATRLLPATVSPAAALGVAAAVMAVVHAPLAWAWVRRFEPLRLWLRVRSGAAVA